MGCADNICTHLHCLVHQLACARLTRQSILRERTDLNLHNAFELLPSTNQRLHSFETRFAIYICKRADMCVAVYRCLRQCTPHIFDDPDLIIFFFDARCQLNGRHSLAHALGVITF